MKNEKSTEYLLNSLRGGQDYGDYIAENKDGLLNADTSEYLCALLTEKKLQRADIANRTGFSKSYIYEIFDGKKKNPSRDAMLIFAFALGLDFDETQTMLKRCGIAQLYIRNRRDSVISHALLKRRDIVYCNNMLEENGEALLAAPIR